MTTESRNTEQKPLKLAVIIYHKDVHKYPLEWVVKCVKSIQQQTHKKFDVFEIDYGNGGTQIYPGSIWESKAMETHAHAHNYLLDKAFFWGYDNVMNVNVDDYYSPDRFEKQLVYAEQGYDVISSNFYNVDENDNIKDTMKMHDRNIIQEANNNMNIIAHPVVCYSKKFWTTCARLNPEEIPRDDFELWKRSYESGNYRFIILPDFLLYYRVHSGKVSRDKEKDNQPNADRVIKSSWDNIPLQQTGINAKPTTDEEKDAHDKAREEWLKTNR